ncbi:MAG TPA: helix-turn-helix domain-containing protein [Azospirillaceae bacterium]|nr:helix-turn-helix domain-containing protein [Azospirillaceae bacterium]
MPIVRMSLEEALKATQDFDFTELDARTDEELTAAALSDPDNPPLTDEELERLRTVMRLKRLRERLGLTQAAFAERYRVPLTALRAWEQGQRMPSPSALAYITVIERIPDAVADALSAA